MIDPGLGGRVVLITGGNNPFGIGAAAARAFAAQGAQVFLHYWRQPDARIEGSIPLSPGQAFYRAQQMECAEELLPAIRSSGGKAEALEADLADGGSVAPLFDEAERLLGPVEIVVNNAAHWEADTFIPCGAGLRNRLVELWTDRPDPIQAHSADRLFQVNTRAPALVMAEYARRHVSRGASWGRIINVGTDGARCFPSEISYGASKYALESYSRSAAAELGRFGITVNLVSPGPVQTGWITAELEREIVSAIPLGRVGKPEDVADVMIFLASDQARWVTGQTIYVGGGHSI